MPSRVLVSVMLVWCLYFGQTRADGLIFQVPADGTWARFDAKEDAEHKVNDGPSKKASVIGTMTVSSVGQLTRNKQPCRWIELKAESKTEGVNPKTVLKMLIPEEYLKRGHDPLSHSLLTFFNPKAGDAKKAPSVESHIDKGFNRIQYEIDRFRPRFPVPLDAAKSMKRETVETPAGRFEDCEVIAGSSKYDGPLLADGRGVFSGTYRIVLHPKAPFGVVSLQGALEGREFSARTEASMTIKSSLTLAAVGKDAVSALPDKPEVGSKKK